MRSIFSLICLGLAVAIFFFYTKPVFDSVQTTNAQIAQYDEALGKAAELQKLKDGLLDRYKALNPDDIARLQKMIPDHVDNIALIMDIDSIASRYGMSLENVDISAPGSELTPAAGEIADPGNAPKYESIAMKFDTVGTYNNFLQFLTDLQSSLRIVDLVNLSVTPSTGAAAGGSSSLYNYGVTINTYWLK